MNHFTIPELVKSHATKKGFKEKLNILNSAFCTWLANIPFFSGINHFTVA